MFVKCKKSATNFLSQIQGGFDMDTKLATIQIRTKQWASIIQDCRSSGLKVDDYCEQHSLSRNAYYYWQRKVKEAALSQAGFVEIQAETLKAETLKAETGLADSPSGSPFFPQTVLSVNGGSVGINQDTPIPLLSQVLGVIRHA